MMRRDDTGHPQDGSKRAFEPAEAEAVRAKNLDIVRRFFVNDGWKTRRALWAEDAVFELPYEIGGPVTLTGRDAILAENDAVWATFAKHEYFDLVVDPTIDPEAFWTVVKSRTVGKREGRERIMLLVNYLRIVDGKVVHRIEFFNPAAQPA
jgi:hypothetical protein